MVNGMKLLGCLALIITLITTPVRADVFNFKPIEDPGKFAELVMGDINKGATNEAAQAVIDAIGQPQALETFQNSLSVLNGKTADFSSVVIDKDYNSVQRQIVYYSYVPSVNFMYYRFNFKRIKAGWALSAFDYQTEGKLLFPPSFQLQE
jgi:ABC-type transporter MlaC component